MRKLIRLQYLQFKRSASKREVFGRIYILACLWVFESVGIVELKSVTGGDLSSLFGAAKPLIIIGILFSLCLSDLIYKLIFKRDATVMDAFLRTRPVPKALWEKYLAVSQLWHPDNLMMPLIVIPICFFLFHFGWGLVAFLAFYIVSVTGGIILMEARRGRNYDEERKTEKKQVRRAPGHGSVFNLQVLSFLRSPRLKTGVIVFFCIFTVYIFLQPDETREFMLFIVFLCSPMIIGQYGFGIEANYFSAVWTKPLPVRRILETKYYFLGELTLCMAVIFTVICLICHIPLLFLLGCTLFTAGMADLLILLDACNATRFDLFGKAFFNYQGAASTFRPIMFLIIFLSMGLGAVPVFALEGWIQFAVLGGMGLLGFAIHRPVFKWVERRFLKNRYKYMEKYSK